MGELIMVQDYNQEAKFVSNEMPITTIDFVHNRIHDGKLYRAGKALLNVAKDGYAYLRLVTPATANKEYHFEYSVTVGSSAYVSMFTGTTYSAAGTAVTPRNRNRISALTTSCLVYHTPTVNVLGTALIDDGYLAGGSGNQAVGAISGERNEWIFGPSTDVLLRVQNKDATGAKDINIMFNWYEE